MMTFVAASGKSHSRNQASHGIKDSTVVPFSDDEQIARSCNPFDGMIASIAAAHAGSYIERLSCWQNFG